MSDVVKFVPHSEKQARALRSTKRILLCGTGTQYGKTTIGAIRMMRKMCTYTDKGDNFLITAPTYKVLAQSTLPAFLKLMDGWGRYNKKDDVFEMTGGGRVYCRTETDPDSIVGITNVRHIWGDEAGKYRLYFWENMQARADFLGCGIDLTTSPYALNWIYHELIKPVREGRRDDVEVIAAASWENPYHFLADPKKRLEKQATMDPRRFDMIYGGEFGKMHGLVFDCFEDRENIVDPFNLPVGTRFVGGVDWGFTEPFVCVIRAITPDGRHYQVSEFYKSGMTLPEQLAVCQQKAKVFGVEKFYAGHERPENILHFNQNGIAMEAADFHIQKGNDLHYELIKLRKYKVFRGTSPYTLDEYETYHYPDPSDLRPDQDAKEQLPVGQNDHAMSANRFITLHTYRRDQKLTPRTPEEARKARNQVERYSQLIKRRTSRQSEDWSA